MRPPDENQANPTEPHLRPNLMSSARRGGNEDSILAKLEREPARRSAAGASGVRLAWYGGAVALAIGLTGALAWLAAGQDGPPPLEVARAEIAPLVLAADEPAAPMATATIVDAAPEPLAYAAPPVTTADVLQHPVAPPLRLLKPADARPAASKPARPAAAAERSVAKAPPRARAPTSRQAARTAKNTGPARAPDTPDSDVALISAVIYHANGHATPEFDAGPERCADDACRPRPTR
ncbi:hypothetical protein AB2N08_18585 [Massilia aurea]|uniref:hypothetical protein n=1 Tax=Massilia aurea TaxID=373040 RepID=UPI003462D97B